MSLLDGHVVALDQSTGRILWNFDSGAPLVSAKQSLTASQGLNVFPGTDGGLYAYHGITHLNPGLEVRLYSSGTPVYMLNMWHLPTMPQLACCRQSKHQHWQTVLHAH